MSENSTSLHYLTYLKLDKILNFQELLSKKNGEEAHMIHQIKDIPFGTKIKISQLFANFPNRVQKINKNI